MASFFGPSPASLAELQHLGSGLGLVGTTPGELFVSSLGTELLVGRRTDVEVSNGGRFS